MSRIGRLIDRSEGQLRSLSNPLFLWSTPDVYSQPHFCWGGEFSGSYADAWGWGEISKFSRSNCELSEDSTIDPPKLREMPVQAQKVFFWVELANVHKGYTICLRQRAHVPRLPCDSSALAIGAARMFFKDSASSSGSNTGRTLNPKSFRLG